MAQQKILLISCYFPPAGGINVQRILSLARYLPENGFRVFVMSARSSVPMMDHDLVKLVPSEVEVHRTWTLEPPFRLRKKLWSRVDSGGHSSTRKSGPGARAKVAIAGKIKKLICPDPQVLWYPFAIRRASKLIRQEGIQTVLVTTPPFSAFLIVNELKRRFPHLCTVADIRDEWLEYFVNEFVFKGDAYVSARAAQIERATVECCDRVVNVTQTSLDRIRSRYPEQPDRKFVLVPNGFDPAAFANFRPRPHNTGKLVFTYTGTVYQPASPKPYLEALDTLPEIRSGIHTRIVGRVAEEFDRDIFFDHRESSVQLFDFVPQTDARRFMEETDVLLLPWSDRINIPGKMYEYLATGKPILAVCYPDSEVAKIMDCTGAGWRVSPDDPDAIRHVLTEIHALGGRSPRPRNSQEIRRFERPRLAAEYAAILRDASMPAEQLNLARQPAVVNGPREPGCTVSRPA
jgi:hypothetical protein